MNRREHKFWRAATDALPTWRDGLGGSDRTYMILATPHTSRTGYKAVVFGRYGGGKGKIKFYPSPEGLGLDRRQLTGLGLNNELGRPAEPYVRYLATLDQVKAVLTLLDPAEWAVCPVDQIESALQQHLGRYTSRVRAPHDSYFQEPEGEAVVDVGGLSATAKID